MKKRTGLYPLIRGFLLVCGLVLIVVVAIAMVGWWGGWTRLERFEKAIMLAGALVMGFGLIGLVGDIAFRLFSGSPVMDSQDEAQDNGVVSAALGHVARRYRFALIALAAGSICVLIGWLLE